MENGVSSGSFVQRVFILGLDGATFDLMKPWMEEGKLPTFATLLRNGAYGKLESVLPILSAPAWTTFATGKNPGKHGIFGFTRPRQGTYDIEYLSGADRRSKTFWEILSESGKQVIAMNVPMTYPPTPVNGLLISGLDAPGTGCSFTYPASLREEILNLAPRYKISMHLGGTLNSGERRMQALQELLNDIDTRAQVAHHLARNYAWDLFVVKFNNPDLVQHHFWKFMDRRYPGWDAESGRQLGDAILRIYQKLDQVVASFLERYGLGTTFMVLSDHGAGMRVPKAIYVNEWLHSLGLLAWEHETKARQHRHFSKVWVRSLLEALLPFSLRYVPHTTKDFLRRLAPGMISKAASYLKFAAISFPATKAYLGEFPSIRLNVKGREPLGIVEPGREYEQLRDFIISQLSVLREPETGLPLFERVCKREELYQGPYKEMAPDIILMPIENKYTVTWKPFPRRTRNKSFIVDEPHWRGTSSKHRIHGILTLQGECNAQAVYFQGAKIVDVAPTVLHLMGLPIPSDMDGRVLTEALLPEFLKSNPIHYQEASADSMATGTEGRSVYSAEEAERIGRMLKSLGYIE